MRISSPPTIGPCHYGIDTPRREELTAAVHSVEEIRSFLDADSLGYLSVEGMLSAAEQDRENVCTACWTDDHPVKLAPAESQQLGLFGKTRR